MSAGEDEPDDRRPTDGDAGPAAGAAPTGGASSADDLPELAPHLRNRYDRPRDVGEIAKGRSQARLILVLLFAALPFVVLVVVVLNSLASGPPDRTVQGQQGGLNEVTRYCTYTIQEGQDYDDCLKRTDYRVLQKEQSNGARYARGELTRCLPDSGPRCTLR
ncbi:hypothetical protein [Patulibacter minatonensis]|uniref:hypothetical protein n=1 Tax=Patulibacter minatonensis TaxID=298163 RepID=UPI00047DB6CA|nr:hypothetical protein [Patulibacter minatonensis]